eukprot:jgi/Chrzof1/1262/Cz01g46220.t1
MSAFGGFVGRLLLASLFILSGAMKFSHYNPQSGGPVVAYMSPKMDNVLQHLHRTAGIHVPLQQEHYSYLVLGAATLELLGAVLFVLNVKLGAILLVIFLIPTTAIMHNFWDLQDGTSAHQIEFVNFMKNLCLLGAFVMYLNMPTTARPAKLKSL